MVGGTSLYHMRVAWARTMAAIEPGRWIWVTEDPLVRILVQARNMLLARLDA